MDLIIIDHVREDPCLYDIKSQFYRDQTMRQEAWEEIAGKINSTVDAVKSTWVKLRNAFIAAKKRRQTKSGQAAKKIQAWKFENEMSFLTPYLEMRDTQTNIEKRPMEEEQEDTTQNIEEQYQTVEKEIPNEESQSQMQQQVQYLQKSLPSSETRRNQNPAQEMVQIMKENAAMRMKRHQAEPKTDLDETDMFYLSTAKTVKCLPQLEQAKIRMQLCKLVSKAEIRVLEGQSGRCGISTVGSPPMTFPLT